jgi:Fe-S-cluster containining protein
MTLEHEDHPTQEICARCGSGCCNHVALEIDRPTTKQGYDNVRWYLLHENVRVFIDHTKRWMVEFVTPCTQVEPAVGCRGYTTRPKICRDYPREDEVCEYLSEEKPYSVRFDSAAQFEEYLDSKGINWRYRTKS